MFLSSVAFFPNQPIRNTIRVSNNLDPDQAQQNIGPDLDPNCLQRLSALAGKEKSEALKVNNKSLEFHPDNNYELLMEPWKVHDLIYLKGCMLFAAAGDSLLEF